MFGGKGYFRGSSVLMSGGAGTGEDEPRGPFHRRRVPPRRARALLSSSRNRRRSTHGTCGRSAWISNAGSRKGLLRIHAARPTLYGLEFHLATMHRDDRCGDIRRWSSSIRCRASPAARSSEVNSMVMRLIDYPEGPEHHRPCSRISFPAAADRSDIEVGVSSLMDTWILLRNRPPGERGGTSPVDSEVARHGPLPGRGRS